MQACDMTNKMFSRSKKLQCEQRKPATINFLFPPPHPHRHHLIIIVHQPPSPSSSSLSQSPFQIKTPLHIVFCSLPMSRLLTWQRACAISWSCLHSSSRFHIFIFQKTKLDWSDETFQLSMTLNRIEKTSVCYQLILFAELLRLAASCSASCPEDNRSFPPDNLKMGRLVEKMAQKSLVSGASGGGLVGGGSAPVRPPGMRPPPLSAALAMVEQGKRESGRCEAAAPCSRGLGSAWWASMSSTLRWAGLPPQRSVRLGSSERTSTSTSSARPRFPFSTGRSHHPRRAATRFTSRPSSDCLRHRADTPRVAAFMHSTSRIDLLRDKTGPQRDGSARKFALTAALKEKGNLNNCDWCV